MWSERRQVASGVRLSYWACPSGHLCQYSNEGLGGLPVSLLGRDTEDTAL